MDKEALDLIEGVRKALVDFGKTQTSVSAKKKTRKITSEVIWSPAPYLDELDNILRTSKTQEEATRRIRSLVRSAEESGIEAMRFLPDDTPHHEVQTRTGGDALTEVDYRRTGPIIQRLSEKHQRTFGSTTGPTGNLPAELSLSNAAHKFDDKATGLERQSGIGKIIPKERTAHPRGTAGFANMKGVDMTSDAAIEANLDKKITEQIDIAKTAIESDAPRQDAVRKLFPGAYQGTADDVAKARPILTPKNTPDLMATYRKLVPSAFNGSFRMSFFGLDQIANNIVKNPMAAIAGAAGYLDPSAITSALQGKYREAVLQTGFGAAAASGISQGLKNITSLDKARALSTVNKLAPRVVNGSIRMGAAQAAGRGGPYALAAYTAYELTDAVTRGITGEGAIKGLQKAGQRAEQEKEELREQGYSEYELRRRARTGYRKP
jgi:hypothetical protein